MNSKTSFNLFVTNFVIGMFRNHSWLRPESQMIKSLGYDIFAIEREFQSTAGKVQPELVAVSSNQSHVLMHEFTSSSNVSSKSNQLARYIKVTSEDLINYLAVPASSAKARSLWVIVPPEAVSSFKNEFVETRVFSEQSSRLLLTSFAQVGEKFEVRTVIGNLADASLTHIIKTRFSYERIPLGFMSVVISDLGVPALLDSVATVLVSQIVAGKILISVSDLCSDMFLVWKQFDPKTKTQIIGAVDNVLKELSKHAGVRNYISRENGSPIIWKLQLVDEEFDIRKFAKNIKGVSKKLHSQYEAGVKQLSLFDNKASNITS